MQIWPPMPRKPKPPTCDDCYFRKNLLCALELEEPCTTFRPNRPEGLVPPKQPVLLMRPPRWARRALSGDARLVNVPVHAGAGSLCGGADYLRLAQEQGIHSQCRCLLLRGS